LADVGVKEEDSERNGINKVRVLTGLSWLRTVSSDVDLLTLVQDRVDWVD